MSLRAAVRLRARGGGARDSTRARQGAVDENPRSYTHLERYADEHFPHGPHKLHKDALSFYLTERP